uniref:hypothetical protein n=1 Tax=Algoriphagus locisalis TaxID=305507 RepID=UPI00147DF8A9|nr:hypothetical protein [Algoriphagus locisalis]
MITIFDFQSRRVNSWSDYLSVNELSEYFGSNEDGLEILRNWFAISNHEQHAQHE